MRGGPLRLSHALPRLRPIPFVLGWPTLQSWYSKASAWAFGRDWKEPFHLAQEQAETVKELRRLDSAWLLSAQDVLRDLSEGLQRDQQEAASEDFESQVNLQKLLLERKASVLKTHRETLAHGISEEEFSVLEEAWQSYFQAKRERPKYEEEKRLVSLQRIKSGSHWNLQDLSRYVKAFASLCWRSGEATSAFKIGSLENHLQLPVVGTPQLHKCLQNEEWKSKYLRNLQVVLRVLGCPLSSSSHGAIAELPPLALETAELDQFFAVDAKERPQKLLELLTAASTSSDLHLVIEGLPRGQRQSVHIAVSMLHRQGKRVQSKSIKEEDGVEVNQLHLWMQKSGEAEDQNVELQDVEQEVCMRLAGLAELLGHEASSRSVIDALIFPLCELMEVQITMEESCKVPRFPTSICDYVLRSGDEVAGVIEAKRCSPNWIWTLTQGVAQCVWQLAILEETQKRTATPCLGLVTDGRRWVCVQLSEHLAVSSSLDISKKEHFWTLLNFLLQHFERK